MVKNLIRPRGSRISASRPVFPEQESRYCHLRPNVADWTCEAHRVIPRANLFSQLSRRSGCTRILGHPEVVEDQPHPAVEVSHLLRDIGDAFGFDEPDREPSEP